MSEPMSNVEIEDVLSSIRRLVSDDLRPQARAVRDDAVSQPVVAQHVVEQPVREPARDKLVLTPALRIVAEPDYEAETETAPVADSHAPAADGPAADSPAADGPVFHTVRSLPDDEAGFVAIDDDSPEAVLARDLPPVEAYDDDDAAAPVDVAMLIPDEVFSRQPEASEWGDAAAPQSGDAHAEGGDAHAEDWADAAEAAVRAELEQDIPQSAFARFVDEPEEAAFDEAAMREMVRDIIREELQGTLGERITRNVRKLVRAEIARALAVRDFE